MGNLNPVTAWDAISGERLKKVNLSSPNGATINYAYLMVDVVLKKCELYFSLSYSKGLDFGIHHSILSIPNEYLPIDSDVYNAGTSGMSGWIQISTSQSLKSITIWGLNLIVTPRGQLSWYYG